MDKYAEAVFVCRTLEQAGYPTMLAGGCVRDRCLGLEPKDYDLATAATPQQVTAFFKGQGKKVIPVGEEHGTVSLITGLQALEITTLREDIMCDGRHARVLFCTDFRSDAMRRDFTINAMFEDSLGQIHDFVGGLGDLQQERLRFVGEPSARIREDYLRILRYFRFLGKLGWAADVEQLQAIAVERAGLVRLSAERVNKELQRILYAPFVSRCLPYLASSGVLRELFPWFQQEVQALAGALKQLNRAPEAVVWHAFFHLGADAWEGKVLSRALEALRFSKQMRRRVLLLEQLIAHSDQPWEGGQVLLRIGQDDRELIAALPNYLEVLGTVGLQPAETLIRLIKGMIETGEPVIPRAELMAQAPQDRGWIVALARIHWFLDGGRGTIDLKEIVSHPEEFRIPMRIDYSTTGSRLT